MRILLVEDDTSLADNLIAQLKQHGFIVDHAANGVDAEFMGNELTYEAAILDLGLPQRNGIEVLQNWRTQGNKLPVIVLTARDAWHERVDGFKAGADDYLGKPFHFEELLARLQALIRRTLQIEVQGQILHCCGLQLNEQQQQVSTPDGVWHELTATEFRLLRYFMMHSGVILSKTRLLEHIYEGDDDRDTNVIEVYVRHLRRILGEERIITKRGQGYVFPDPTKSGNKL